MKTKRKKEWQNVSRNFSAHPLVFFEPESLADLAAIVQEAEAAGLRVRAVGSGHSYSDVAIGDDYLVDLCRLDKVLASPPANLKKDYAGRRLVEAEAGIRIQRFNRELDHRGYCLTNMGAIDNQTLAGAISTGTHGTGLELPALHGAVRSIVLVTHGGRILRLEAADGPTDPAKFHDPVIELIQDDRLFYASLVSLGCFGLIYALTFEVEAMFWLEENKQLTSWSALKPLMESGALFETDAEGRQKYRHLSVLINPYATRNGDHTCIVTRQRLLREHPPAGIADATRNVLKEIGGGLPLTYWIFLARVRNKPERIPKTIDTSLHAMKDKRYLNKGYRVMHQGNEFLKSKAFDTEFAFPIQPPRVDCVPVIEQLFAAARQLADERRLFQTGPLGIRFVAPSEALIAPEYRRTVCYIDMPFLVRYDGATEVLDHFQDLLLASGGIPHWGKINNRLDCQPEILHRLHPALAAWKSVFRELNPRGTFSSGFSDRLKLGEGGARNRETEEF